MIIQNLYSDFAKLLGRASVLVAVSLLVGCASTISARVTTYEQWPENVQGETYEIVTLANQTRTLEYQSFADMVRAALGPTGLVEAQPGSKARFNVAFE